MWFTAEMSGMLEMQKFHLSYNILLPQRADSWLPFPSPRVCRVSVRSYADVITKFYYVNIDLRHQYGISAAESQTILREKRLQRGETGVFAG